MRGIAIEAGLDSGAGPPCRAAVLETLAEAAHPP